MLSNRNIKYTWILINLKVLNIINYFKARNKFLIKKKFNFVIGMFQICTYFFCIG